MPAADVDEFGSNAEDIALQVMASTSATLSVCGSSYVLLRIVRSSCKGRMLQPTDHLIAVLATLDLFVSVAMALGRLFVPAPGDTPSGLCVAQAISIQFFGVATLLWTAMISLTIVNSLRPGSSPLAAVPTVKHTLMRLLPTLLTSLA